MERLVENKNIAINIYRTQTYDSIMCRYFCFVFFNLMLNSKRLTDFTNLFSPTNFKKNHEIIIEYFRHFDNSMKEKC